MRMNNQDRHHHRPFFATKEKVSFNTTDEAMLKTVTLDIPTLLNKFILFWRKPRWVSQPAGSSNGLDPNWMPATNLKFGSYPNDQQMESDRSHDLHGFVKEFLIEPATPPHDPELWSTWLMSNLTRKCPSYGPGRSCYPNTIVTSFKTRLGAMAGMTPSLAIQGGVGGSTMVSGHTIEIPESNQESYRRDATLS